MSGPLKPHALLVDADSIPAELKSLPQWVNWRYTPNKQRDDWTKTPLQSRYAIKEKVRNASSKDPKTWATFNESVKAYVLNPPVAGNISIPDNPDDDPGHNGLDGQGVMLTFESGITGADLDHCLDAGGKPLPWAEPILERFTGTYIEVSPSGTGIRIFCYGQKPGTRSKRGDVEMYDGRSADGTMGGRYLTITGHSYGDPQPITAKQEAVNWLYQEYLEEKPKGDKARPGQASGSTQTPNLSDAALLQKMFDGKDGAAKEALWNGDTSAHPSESEADLALASHLAWWSNYHLERADSLFRQSGLMREKWDESRGSSTYGELTLEKAFAGKQPGEGYTGERTNEKDTTEATPTEDEAPWEDMLDLPALYPPVPALPPELIPEPLRVWLQDIAERTSLPLEFVACPALVSLGSVIGRTVGIYPKRFDDWLVVPNLWGGVVGRPGVMKTAAISEASKPLKALAVAAREKHEQEAARAEAERAALELQISALKENAKRDAKKAHGISSTFQADLQGFIAQLAEATTTERRYLTQDATTEKLGELLQDNPRGMLLLRDELAGWLRTLERAGREGEREFYLEAWNGTGGYTFDRIGRGTIHIEALTLSIMGAIQPGKLERYLQEAMEGGGGADGLLQRFQLVVWPDVTGNYVHVDRYPNSPARKRANNVFAALDELDSVALGLDAQESDIPALHFSTEAQALFDTWRAELETRLRSGDLAYKPAFESHLSKYRSLMPSLALIFHLVAVVDKTADGPVSLEAAQLAAVWCDYLEAHALKLYAPEVSSHIKAAQLLKEHIEDDDVKDGQTVRDIYRNQWEGLGNRDAVMSGLEVLAEANCVRVEEVGTSGRPALKVRLHPKLRGKK